MHVHKQLRDAVMAQVTGLVTTGLRVFSSRVYPMEESEMPGLCVFVLRDEATPLTIHELQYERLTEVKVQGYAKTVGDMEDVLDQMKSEVETALAGLTLVNDKAIYLVYSGCESELLGEGDQKHGVVTMSYRASLVTNAVAPDILI